MIRVAAFVSVVMLSRGFSTFADARLMMQLNSTVVDLAPPLERDLKRVERGFKHSRTATAESEFCEEAPGACIAVYVDNGVSDVLLVEFSKGMTVKDLKEKVSEMATVPVYQQCMHFDGQALEDGPILADAIVIRGGPTDTSRVPLQKEVVTCTRKCKSVGREQQTCD